MFLMTSLPCWAKNETATRREVAEEIEKLMQSIDDNRDALNELFKSSLTKGDLEALNKLIYDHTNRLNELNQENRMLENQLETVQDDMNREIDAIYEAEDSRLKLNGELKFTLEHIRHKNDTEGNDFQGEERIRLSTGIPLIENTSAFLRIEQKYLWGNKAAGYATSVYDPRASHTYNDPSFADRFNDQNINFKEAYVNVRNLTNIKANMRIGRQFVKFGHGLFFSEDLDGLKFDVDVKGANIGIYTFDTDNIYDGMYNNYKYDTTKKNRQYGKESDTDGFNFLGLKCNIALTNRHFLEMYRVSEKISKYSTSKTYQEIAGIPIDDPLVPTTYQPVWTGFSLDGKLGRKLDYNLEYVHMDSHFDSLIDAFDDLDVWDKENWTFNVKSAAWLAAFQFRLDPDNKFLIQYGAGDEEFLAYGIDYDYRLNDMRGNWNPGYEPFCSFTGVKDLLCRFSHRFSNRTRAYLQYEQVTHKDTSNVIPNARDYDLVSLNTMFDYGRNHIGLSYEHLHYKDSSANTQGEIGAVDDDDVRPYHTYGGGRHIFKATYSLEF